MVNNFGNSVILQCCKKKWVGLQYLKYGRKSVKIDILYANATFIMKKFDLRLTCTRQYCLM